MIDIFGHGHVIGVVVYRFSCVRRVCSTFTSIQGEKGLLFDSVSLPLIQRVLTLTVLALTSVGRVRSLGRTSSVGHTILQQLTRRPSSPRRVPPSIPDVGCITNRTGRDPLLDTLSNTLWSIWVPDFPSPGTDRDQSEYFRRVRGKGILCFDLRRRNPLFFPESWSRERGNDTPVD